MLIKSKYIKKKIYEDIDFTTFSIIGSQLYGNNHLNTAKYNGIKSFDHWLYGYCNKEINTKGLDDLTLYFLDKYFLLKKINYLYIF